MHMELPNCRASDTQLYLLVMLQIQFDYVEYSTLRIAQDSEATHVRDISWRNILPAAKGSSFLCGPIAVVNRNINSPVGRHRSHLRLNLHYPADVIVAIHDLGIRRCATICLGLPTKELRIKIDGLGRVVG